MAYAVGSRRGASQRAQAVAFNSIVGTQLAQTLDFGRTEGQLSGEVLTAVAATASIVALAFALPPLRAFLGLALPTPAGAALCLAAAPASVAISRRLGAGNGFATVAAGGSPARAGERGPSQRGEPAVCA